MSTPFPGVHSRARALITRMRRGGTGQEVAELTELARRNPRRVAELAVELALLATEDGALPWLVGEREPADPELRAAALRHGHALHRRQIRTGWVMWAERLYQRDSKRHRRGTEAA